MLKYHYYNILNRCVLILDLIVLGCWILICFWQHVPQPWSYQVKTRVLHKSQFASQYGESSCSLGS